MSTDLLLDAGLQPARLGDGVSLQPLDERATTSHQWAALSEASVGRSVFQSPGWVRLALPHDSKRGRETVLLSTGRFVLPLSIAREQGFKIARILAEPLAQYSDGAGEAPSSEELGRALKALRREKGVDLLVLRRVRDDAAIAPALEALGALRSNETVAPDILLCPTGPRPAPTGSLPSDYRDAIRRKRKLGAKSELSFHVEMGGPEAAAIVRLSLEWKAEWARERRIVSRLLTPEFREDFVALFCARDSGAAVGVLKENGEPVGVTAGFVHGQRFYDYLGAYRADRGPDGVAKITIAETADWAGAQGLTEFDFLPPGDAYKLTWTKTCAPVHDRSLPLSALGRTRAKLIDAGLVPAAKKAIKSLPPGLRGLIARAIS
jgi:CelD/BcsL family acetyltransferase involved in cellulose biosynthesis